MDLPKTEWVNISPGVADEWLKKYNTKNRALSVDRVVRYAEDIEQGQWIITHQGVAFDEDGNLVDGAHRLTAIVLADSPVLLLVTWGLPREARFVIDQGKPRSVEDAIAITSETKVRPEVIRIAKTTVVAPSFGVRVCWSPAMVTDIIDRNVENMHDVVAQFQHKGKLPGRTQLMTLAVRAMDHLPKDVVSSWIKILVTGEGLGRPADGAVIRLRDWLRDSNEPRLGGTAGPRMVYQKAQASLAAFNEGRGLSKLYAVADDLFPMLEHRKPSWLDETLTRFGVGERIITRKAIDEYDPTRSPVGATE